eukprot:scaffold1486_cov329-Prasinococcus_capsulatus_cf.AAC.24
MYSTRTPTPTTTQLLYSARRAGRSTPGRRRRRRRRRRLLPGRGLGALGRGGGAVGAAFVVARHAAHLVERAALLVVAQGVDAVAHARGVLLQEVGPLGAAAAPKVLDLHDLGQDGLVVAVLARGGVHVHARVHVAQRGGARRVVRARLEEGSAVVVLLHEAPLGLGARLLPLRLLPRVLPFVLGALLLAHGAQLGQLLALLVRRLALRLVAAHARQLARLPRFEGGLRRRLVVLVVVRGVHVLRRQRRRRVALDLRLRCHQLHHQRL